MGILLLNKAFKVCKCERPWAVQNVGKLKNTYKLHVILVSLHGLLLVDIQWKFCGKWPPCASRNDEVIIGKFLAIF